MPRKTTKAVKPTADFPEVLNAEQAAELLDTSPAVVRRMCAQGRIPAQKVGREWRMAKSAVLEWLSERH